MNKYPMKKGIMIPREKETFVPQSHVLRTPRSIEFNKLRPVRSAVQVRRIRRTIFPPVLHWLGVLVVPIEEILCRANSIPEHSHEGENKQDGGRIHGTGRKYWLQR